MSNDAQQPDNLDRRTQQAIADLNSHTLGAMIGQFSQLIYLASLRDHNTGKYHHYGLESQYGEEVADRALHSCHHEVFKNLLGLSLKAQTEDLVAFFESLREEKARLVEAWERLRSYQVLPPEGCHPLTRELFEKNIEIILKILRETDLWPLLRDPHGDADNLA